MKLIFQCNSFHSALEVGINSVLIYSCVTIFFLSCNNQFCDAVRKRKYPREMYDIATDYEDPAKNEELRKRTYQIHKEDVIIPSTVKQTGTLIFLHDANATGHDWCAELEKIRQPYVKLFCPSSIAITEKWNMTMANTSQTIQPNFSEKEWFRRGHDENGLEDLFGMRNASDHLHNLVEMEIKNGVPSNRILIGGIGHGGVLAFHAGLTCRRKLAGILAICAYVPLINQFEEVEIRENKNIPIMQCNIGNDTNIPLEVAQVSSIVLKDVSNKHTFKKYRGIEDIRKCDVAMEDVRKFINKRLPPTTLKD